MASIQFQIITRNTTRGNVKSQGGEGEEGERGGSKDQTNKLKVKKPQFINKMSIRKKM